jgi:hypothetical protein
VVAPGQTRALAIPVVQDNSTISGTFRDGASGRPQLGLAGAVFAGSTTGGRARARVNPLTAGYTLEVASTVESGQGGSTWLVRPFVDPTNGFVVQRPRLRTVFLPYNNGEGADVTLDVAVARINTQIEGRVFNADGTPARGARVSIRETTPDAATAYTRWVLTNASGGYRVAAPVGSYRISAHLRNAAPPVPETVTTVANTTTVAPDLRLRTRDATIGGQVTRDGTGTLAFVRATSASGGRALATTDAEGNYTLRVNSGEVWQVRAVAQLAASGDPSSALFLQSPQTAVTPAPGANGGVNLALAVVDTLPAAVALTFDAAQDQTLTLADGSQLVIPAGAMAESGLVTVAVRPLAELAADGGAEPVRFGYRLLAFDSDKRPIVRFRAPVTVVLPFTAAQLAALGVTPEQLVPAYWDEASESWQPEEQVTVEVDANGDGVVRAEVLHFTDYALLASPVQRVYLPLAGR